MDADPNNYMSYYKRATVYMALSRSRPALADLDKILELKPDFLKVHILSLFLLLYVILITTRLDYEKYHMINPKTVVVLESTV